MTEAKTYDIAIVGGGIAGYTAALTAKNLQLDVLWLGAEKFGEKARAAERVRNFPAFSGSGAELCALLDAQREKEGVPFTTARVDGVFAAGDGFVLSAGKAAFRARTVILATGADVAGGIAGERELFGRGVSYCAVCDGALYRGKTVAAVLFSPEFAEEAEFLASFAERVHCFCVAEPPRFRAKNIVVHTGAPERIEGAGRVERVVCGKEELPVSAVFLLKHSAPPQALVGGLKTDGAHIPIGRDGSTNLGGLFAAGDVTGTPYQFAKAAGEGLVAAFSAKKFISAHKNR